MKEAMFYKKKKHNIIQCELCPRYCIIPEGKRGNCNVRENKAGKLYSLVYEYPCSIAVDPIEKKPFYHFLPDTKVFSVGTVGCNLHCKSCQNYQISQAQPEQFPTEIVKPEIIVREAVKSEAKSIGCTYNDPIVFYEYALDIAKIAKKKDIKNVWVSNGFINPEPLKKLCKYIDAANIDLKSMDNEFYKRYCKAWLDPVLKSLKILKKEKVFIEITNLIISGLNDKPSQIKKMCSWVKKNLGADTPLHFSRFFPCYKLIEKEATPESTLHKARKIAQKEGLKFVYIGNIFNEEAENTYCHKCKEIVIERRGFGILRNNLIKGKCPCGEKVAGVWE